MTADFHPPGDLRLLIAEVFVDILELYLQGTLDWMDNMLSMDSVCAGSKI